jgi:hypothetical protein
LIVTPVAYSLLDDLGATATWRSLASRIYALTHPFRKKVRPTEAASRITSEIDKIGDEIKAAAKADDEMKISVGD